ADHLSFAYADRRRAGAGARPDAARSLQPALRRLPGPAHRRTYRGAASAAPGRRPRGAAAARHPAQRRTDFGDRRRTGGCRHPGDREPDRPARRRHRPPLLPARRLGAGGEGDGLGMIYDVAHLTRYQYGAPVVANDCVLRLRPRDEPGQRISNYHVEVRPMPREFVEREDAFGNHAARLRIETRHTQMSIKSSFRAEVARAAPPIATLTPPWETAAALAAASPSIAADSPAFGLYPSRLASLFADATCYARHSFAPARPVYEA